MGEILDFIIMTCFIAFMVFMLRGVALTISKKQKGEDK